MGMDGVGCCSASMRSADAPVTVSAGDRLGKLFWAGNIYAVSEACSDAVLGMYNVRNI